MARTALVLLGVAVARAVPDDTAALIQTDVAWPNLFGQKKHKSTTPPPLFGLFNSKHQEPLPSVEDMKKSHKMEGYIMVGHDEKALMAAQKRRVDREKEENSPEAKAYKQMAITLNRGAKTAEKVVQTGMETMEIALAHNKTKAKAAVAKQKKALASRHAHTKLTHCSIITKDKDLCWEVPIRDVGMMVGEWKTGPLKALLPDKLNKTTGICSENGYSAQVLSLDACHEGAAPLKGTAIWRKEWDFLPPLNGTKPDKFFADLYKQAARDKVNVPIHQNTLERWCQGEDLFVAEMNYKASQGFSLKDLGLH